VEDRADYVLSTGFLQAAGRKRNGSDQVGQCGDLGQFTSYLPGACEPSSYTYLQADSLYAMEGAGGLGFLMLDGENNIKYASNAKNLCIPSSVGTDWTIYSYDADGTMHEVTKAVDMNGTEYIEVTGAGRLKTELTNNQVIKLIVSGPVNSTDVNYMKQLVTKENLLSIDLVNAKINSIPSNVFQNVKKIVSFKLPQALTSIGSNSFSSSGLKSIEIPDKVTSVGGDAFAYCDRLTTVVIGQGVKTMDQGVFYSSAVKDAYVKALTPPTIANYLFSSKPVIHVYASALDNYLASPWAEFGTIVGDLDDYIVGIDSPSIDSDGEAFRSDEAVYNMQGMRVTKLQPGTIYIQNGKKIISRK